MQELRKKNRGYTNDYFLVFDMNTGEILGRLINLSPDGIMLISDDPIELNQTFKSRMILPELIDGKKEIYFDLQARWCNKNKRADWYETGYEIINKSENCLKVLYLLASKYMNHKERVNKDLFA